MRDCAYRFIVLEGLDGSGKTTQAEMLKDFLESKEQKVWLTSEPTDGCTGELLKRIQRGEFKQYFKRQLDFNRFMAYLYSADRVGHYQKIEEHLDNGEWVICDRYKYSTYAYNNPGDIVSYSLLDDFKNPLFPFYLDIPVSKALERINQRNSKLEIFETKTYLENVAFNYSVLCQRNELIHIDGDRSKEEVFSDLKNIVSGCIKKGD